MFKLYAYDSVGVIERRPLPGYVRPKLDIVSPTNTQIFSEKSPSLIPIVRVSDSDGDTLTTSYSINSEPSPRETKTITNTVTAQTISFNALNVSTLPEGTHTIKFTVNDGQFTTTQTADFTVDHSSPAIGAITVATTEASFQISGSAVDAHLSSTPYRYTVGSMVSGWTDVSTYTQAGLNPNTAYPVTFEARDNAGHIAVWQQAYWTKAQSPFLKLSENMETSLQLALQDANPPGTEYQIKSGEAYVGATGNLTSSSVWMVPTTKTVRVNGLRPNTQYSFQVKARNGSSEETPYSALAQGSTLASPPTQVIPETSQHWIKLSWPATDGASSYDVEADGMVMNNGTALSYLHNGLAPSTSHRYRVRVNNAGGTGSWSPLVSAITLPEPPAIPSNLQAAAAQTEITLSWDAVAGAGSYEVEADGVVVNNGEKTAYTQRALQPSTDHVYRVRARNAGGESAWSLPLTQRTLPYPPAMPEKVTAQLSIHQVAINWDKVAGADGYEMEADGLIVDNGGATSYIHDGLDALSGHTYRVRAKNAGGQGPWSSPLHVTTHPEIPAVPTNVMAAAEEKSIVLTWYQTSYAESYEVELDGVSVVEAARNQFTHSGLTANSKHSYRIRAKNISGSSNWSSPITLATFPDQNETGTAVTNIVAVVTNRMITLSWDAVALDARYEIEADGVLKDNGDNTIYLQSGLNANEFHTYKIRVKKEDDPNQWVAILSLSTLPDPPDAPGKLEAFATNTSIELRWQKMTGATGYDLEIDGKTVNIGDLSSYLHENLASGTGHVYRLRAKNMTGVTAWSNAILKSTTSPTYTVKAEKDHHFDLSLIVYNVQDFSELTYVVTYDPNQVEVMDLYDYTPQPDVTASGRIPGSILDVTHTPGKITYKVNQSVVPGTSWSGEISTIIFKSKIDGESAIRVVVQ